MIDLWIIKRDNQYYVFESETKARSLLVVGDDLIKAPAEVLVYEGRCKLVVTK